MSTTISVRLEDDLARDFIRVVEEIGLDAPTVIGMLVMQTVQQRRIPLSLSASPDSSSTLAFIDSVSADWGEW
jgi:addiction module RelB/DinJ family antitoxin